MGYGAVRWEQLTPKLVTSTTGEAYNLLSRHLHHPPSCYAYPRPHSSRSIHHAIQRPPSAPVRTFHQDRHPRTNLPSLGGLLVLTRTGNPSASLADSRLRIYPSELSFTCRMVSTLPDLHPPTCSLLVIVGQRCEAHGKSHQCQLERMSCSRIWCSEPRDGAQY